MLTWQIHDKSLCLCGTAGQPFCGHALGRYSETMSHILVWTEAAWNLDKKANVFAEPFLVTQQLVQ